MNAITGFLNKWGLTILVVMSLSIFMNTCGTKSKIEKLDKKVQSMELTINENDSINREISSIEREISNLEIAREVVYTNNTIVRTEKRPDDVMNDYSTKIKELTMKLNKIKDARK